MSCCADVVMCRVEEVVTGNALCIRRTGRWH